MTQALATLLPTALQHSFQQQLQVRDSACTFADVDQSYCLLDVKRAVLQAVNSYPQADTESAAKLPTAKHVKRQKTAHSPSEDMAKASQYASTVEGGYVAPAPVTPKVEETCVPPLPNSKSAQAIQIDTQLEHYSQSLQTNTVSEAHAAKTQHNSSAAAQTASQFRGNLKRIKDAETFQRQKERRQKKAAFLLDGTTTGPVIGVAKDDSWGQELQQHPVRLPGGQSVQLPVRPNRFALSVQSFQCRLNMPCNLMPCN